MKKTLVCLFACLLIFTFFLPKPTVTADSIDGLPIKNDLLETGILFEGQIFLPMILNGLPCSKAPTLLEPANSAFLNTLTPLFRWDTGDNPYTTRFRLELAKDAEFNQGITSLTSSGFSGIGEFRFPQNLEPASTIFWRAYLICGELQSPYTPTWSFLTGSGGTIPSAPILVSPEDESTPSLTPITLQWEPVEGAIEYLVRWTETGASWYNFAYTSETCYTLWGVTPSATYDWWIAALNEYAIGIDSEKWQFTAPAETQSINDECLLSTPNVYRDRESFVISE